MTCLLAIMTLAVLFQPTTERFQIALLYWFAVVGYSFIGEHIDGAGYYLIGAGLDVALITALGAIRTVSRLSIGLMIASCISILLNAVGSAMWFLYMPPTVYNDSYYLLYGAAIIIMTLKDPADVGYHQRDSVWSRVRCHALQSRQNVSRGNHPL